MALCKPIERLLLPDHEGVAPTHLPHPPASIERIREEDEELRQLIQAPRYHCGPQLNYLAIGAALTASTRGVRRVWSTKNSKKQEVASFNGADVVRWIKSTLDVTKEVALRVARRLLLLKVFVPVPSGNENRFDESSSAWYATAPAKVGNHRITWDRPTLRPLEIVYNALQMLLNLFQYYKPIFRFHELSAFEASTYSFSLSLSSEYPMGGLLISRGNWIVRGDPLYEKFLFAIAPLQRVDLAGLGHEERATFFMNVYNMLTLHTLLLHPGVVKSRNVLGRIRYFRKVLYDMGGHLYHLWDIDHACLRAGSNGPAGLFSGILLPKFKSDDPRFPFRMREPVPLVNFALNVATVSSPPIRIYRSDSLMDDLAANATVTLEAQVTLENPRSGVLVVRLPKILQWFYQDFGASEKFMLVALFPYLPPSVRYQIESAQENEERLSIKFDEYHWTFHYPV